MLIQEGSGITLEPVHTFLSYVNLIVQPCVRISNYCKMKMAEAGTKAKDFKQKLNKSHSFHIQLNSNY